LAYRLTQRAAEWLIDSLADWGSKNGCKSQVGGTRFPGAFHQTPNTIRYTRFFPLPTTCLYLTG